MDNRNNEITECLNDVIQLLKEVEAGIDMNKANYCKLCDTPLRHTDTLGKLLGEKLGCVYIKREPTYYCFNFNDDPETELHISNIEPFSVDIILKKYYTIRDFFWGDSDPFHYDAVKQLRIISDKIRDLKSLDYELQYLKANKSRIEETIAKANQNRSVFDKLLGRFTTDECVTSILEETKAKITTIEEQIKCLPSLQELNEYEQCAVENVNRTTQEMDITLEKQKAKIEEYSMILFKWTDTVMVYDQNGQNVGRLSK